MVKVNIITIKLRMEGLHKEEIRTLDENSKEELVKVTYFRSLFPLNTLFRSKGDVVTFVVLSLCV